MMHVFSGLILLVLLFPTAAEATEIPSTVIGTDGAIDPAKVAAFVVSVEPSLREWPTRFRSKEHKKQVLGAMQRVIRQLNGAKVSDPTDQELLTNVAHILAMGHNADMGTAPAAKELFEKAIALNPEDRRTNYLFGMFLVSTRAYHFESLPYLRKAYALGEKDALYSIGLVLVRKGEKEKGLRALETYAKEHPQSAHTRRIIRAIKVGELRFVTK